MQKDSRYKDQSVRTFDVPHSLNRRLALIEANLRVINRMLSDDRNTVNIQVILLTLKATHEALSALEERL